MLLHISKMFQYHFREHVLFRAQVMCKIDVYFIIMSIVAAYL